MKKLIIVVAILMVGCVNLTLPPGQENVNSFIQNSAVPYQNAYRVIAKQMRACYRVIGLFGNGYDVQADLDTANKQGIIEIYHVGLVGASKAEDSIQSRTVTVSDDLQGGSIIKTTGTTPKIVYLTHRTIPEWLSGKETCSPASN